MAATQVGIVRIADGTIKVVINPTNDSELDAYPLASGETMSKLTLVEYATFKAMTALAAAKGWKVR